MWVLQLLDDIESDMSAFHRVDDITTLDGPRFFKLAWRLSAYQGVIRARLSEQESSAEATSAPHGAGAGAVNWNPGTKATLQADPALRGIFSFG